MKIERVSRQDTPRHDSSWLDLMGHFCWGLWGEHKENMQNAHKSHWLDGCSAGGNHRDDERDGESWRNRSASRRKQFQVRAWGRQSWQGRPCVCRINDFLFVKSKRNSQRIHVPTCVSDWVRATVCKPYVLTFLWAAITHFAHKRIRLCSVSKTPVERLDFRIIWPSFFSFTSKAEPCRT